MRQRTIHLNLSNGWHEVLGRAPRQYRRHDENAGVLTVGLHPPPDELVNNPEGLLAWLRGFLNEDPDRRQVVIEKTFLCRAGPGAYSLRRSDHYGLIGV
jgi:hypothetical protein